MEKRQRYQRLLGRLAVITGFLLVFVICFLSMFAMFEAISMQAMLRMNTEFSAQVSSISDSIQALINTIGTQVFYISPTVKLRQSTSLTRNAMVFAIRELWQYVSASQMLHSIFVYNGREDYIYTTDNTYSSAPIDGFYDQKAAALFRRRSAENRAELIYRVFDSEDEYPKPIELFSYLVFEVDFNGRIGDSAIMLNLNADWFAENLLAFSEDRYIIVSPEGYVVATQDASLTEHALALLPKVQGKPSGYLIENRLSEPTVCFYSPMNTNGWYCLRFMAYQNCLPGLARLRSVTLGSAGVLFSILFMMILYTLIRIYFPYRLLSSALKANAGDSAHPKDAMIQLSEMVVASRTREQEEALGHWLSGQDETDGLKPPLPATLLMAEETSKEQAEPLLRQAQPEAVIIERNRCCVILCGLSEPLEAAETCNHLAAALQTRVYYSLTVTDILALPQRFDALNELKALRFFSPGQRVFSETLLSTRVSHTDGLEEAIGACLTAAKSSGEAAACAALADLTERLHGCRYADVLFALKRLDYLLNAALPENTPLTDGLEAAMAEAEDVEALQAYYMPRFRELAAGCRQQRLSREREVAGQVAYRLEQGYKDPSLDVQMIAEEMGLSPAYIRKQFFHVYEQTIRDYLNNVRMEQAGRLLMKTALPVEQIAKQIGFDNTKYMFVLFKKQFGVTPRQYRMQPSEKPKEK